MHLEARRQSKLPEPTAAGTIQWADVVDLRDRKAEHVGPQRDAGAANPFAFAAGKGGLESRRPGHTGIAEKRHFDREWAVEGTPREQAEQREPEFGAGH